MRHHEILGVIGLSASLIGCGGGGSPASPSEPVTTTAQGQFIDNPVEGLSYVSGELSGVTDASGGFLYQLIDDVPQSVQFTLGDIDFGTVSGGPFITPRDLSTSSEAQTNIIRLLLTLDADGDADNGIDLTAMASNTSAFSGSGVDFTDTDFENSAPISSLLSEASTILSRGVVLVDGPTANSHIMATYQCLVSGNYYGTFTGDDNGPIVLGVDPATGFVGGVGWSRPQSTPVGVPFGTTMVSNANNFGFSETSSNNFVFSGNVSGFTRMIGSWTQNGSGGEFALNRIANSNATSVVYRFTGTYLADIPAEGITPIGAVSVNVMENGEAEGELVNIVVGTTQVSTVSGTFTGGQFTLSATNGMTLNGSYDLPGLTMAGTWSNPSSVFTSGTLALNGCLLNP